MNEGIPSSKFNPASLSYNIPQEVINGFETDFKDKIKSKALLGFTQLDDLE